MLKLLLAVSPFIAMCVCWTPTVHALQDSIVSAAIDHKSLEKVLATLKADANNSRLPIATRLSAVKEIGSVASLEFKQIKLKSVQKDAIAFLFELLEQTQGEAEWMSFASADALFKAGPAGAEELLSLDSTQLENGVFAFAKPQVRTVQPAAELVQVRIVQALSHVGQVFLLSPADPVDSDNTSRFKMVEEHFDTVLTDLTKIALARGQSSELVRAVALDSLLELANKLPKKKVDSGEVPYWPSNSQLNFVKACLEIATTSTTDSFRHASIEKAKLHAVGLQETARVTLFNSITNSIDSVADSHVRTVLLAMLKDLAGLQTVVPDQTQPGTTADRTTADGTTVGATEQADAGGVPFFVSSLQSASERATVGSLIGVAERANFADLSRYRLAGKRVPQLTELPDAVAQLPANRLAGKRVLRSIGDNEKIPNIDPSKPGAIGAARLAGAGAEPGLAQ